MSFSSIYLIKGSEFWNNAIINVSHHMTVGNEALNANYMLRNLKRILTPIKAPVTLVCLWNANTFNFSAGDSGKMSLDSEKDEKMQYGFFL